MREDERVKNSMRKTEREGERIRKRVHERE